VSAGARASVTPHGSEAVERALSRLGDALREPRSSAAICVYALPAPVAPMATLLARFAHEQAALWEPCQGPALAAIGATAQISASGTRRFRELFDGASALWAGLETVNLSDDPAPAPRLLGGLAFQVGKSREAPWTSFGDGAFVLPRLLYVRSAEHAHLCVALAASVGSNEREALLEEVHAALTALYSAPRSYHLRGRSPNTRIASTHERSAEDWAERVAAIRHGIAAGRLEKVVLARRVLLTLDPAPDPLEVLERLRDEAPHATRFAFRRGSCTFLGATPERLLSKSGVLVETEALAGSQRAGGAGSGAELLGSRKDLAEHAIVVREVLRTLTPLCSELVCPGEPVVRELRHVQHLWTPIRARLRDPVHVLELVEKLHPTPAVGGVPRADALSWIAEHEPDERGWYAGPIGWFDAAGDGEFAVALRSGVLEGARADLYVGAGIVDESNASSEYSETALKLRTLQLALGVAG